ncbi:1,4-alpha-glucan branching protein [Streptomyces sp. PSKA54]|uniref:1,4-alpha-glucan branching protein n=1 Tax=Streptomyces himalayensis subsp. aureolus TaxID=2758039 RepID=A0A7W2CXH8_9ACTN|nr:1,4-alpha-glucan branching protein [Streptomyces himalayensis]MBA4860903.1 1,4-alpha-glucan branching protein [Streptomyces himalayensis subsp. aureolus]
MAVIHRTTLTPSKLELLSSWLPEQSWYRGRGSKPELTKAGGFRLDDPQGEVGIEFMAVTDASGDQPVTYHVPLSYRGQPLDVADHALIGTAEHGVLGRRWIYDGTQDPVLVTQLFALITGESEPQAQSTSNAPDTSVTSHFSETGHTAAISLTAVTNGPEYTDLLVQTDDAPGSGTRPGGQLIVRVIRILEPGRDVSSAHGAKPLGHVTANWLQPDGTRAQDFFSVVHDAATARGTRLPPSP